MIGMKTLSLRFVMATILTLPLGFAAFAPQDAKQDMKDAGSDAKSAAKSTAKIARIN